MNVLSVRHPGETQRYAQSWACSLLLHGLTVGAAIVLVSDLHLAPQPPPFTWEVSVVEPPSPQEVEHPTPVHSEPAPAAPTPAETEPEPVIQTMQAKAVPTVQAEQIVHQEVRAVNPVIQETKQSTQTVSQSVQSLEASHKAAIVETSVVARDGAGSLTAYAGAPVTRQVIASSETYAVGTDRQGGCGTGCGSSGVVTRRVVGSPGAGGEAAPGAGPAVVTRQVVEDASPVIAEGPSVVSRPAVAATLAPTGIQERTVVKEGTIKAPGAAPVEHASMRELPVRSLPVPKADYGWLAETLWRQVEKLKRYPHTARLNRWEGKVILRAVIKDDGQLLDVAVEESSGYSVLDHDAMEIVKQASPVQLKHALGKPQVVVHVPISYKLQ